MKVLSLFPAFIVFFFIAQGQRQSPALQKTLKEAMPPNASASVPIKTFPISEEEQAEIEKYMNTPCGKLIGWEKGRDNVKLYKECEHDLMMKKIWSILRAMGIVVGVGVFSLLFLNNLVERRRH